MRHRKMWRRRTSMLATALVVLGLTVATVGVLAAGAQVSITVPTDPNPPLPAKCGLDLALVFDLSNSITATQFTEMQQAGIDLASDLAGTPSSIGVYTFASFAPAFNTSPTSGTPASNAPLPAVSLSTPAGVIAVQTRIRQLTRVQTTFGGTNWDQALRQVIAAGQPHYDAVLFITDGSPTFYGPGSSPQGPGNSTTTPVIDAAVTAANLVKAANTRVIAVGVSDTIGPDVAYLRAISGTTANAGPASDYFVTSFAALRNVLVSAAAEHCFGTVTVVKEVQQPNGTRAPAGGWEFAATASGGATVMPPSGVTASDGTTNFAVSASTTLTMSETVQTGFRLLQQAGLNAVCTWNAGPPKEDQVTNLGTNGFSVPVATTDIVSCTVVNEVIPATLTLNKIVDNIPGSGNAQPSDWILTAVGPAPSPGTALSGTSGITSPIAAGTYTLSESGGPPGPPSTPSYTASAWVCTGTGVTQPSGTQVTLAADAVGICTITNTEVPTVKLVQNKTVDASLAVTGETLTYTMTVQNVGTGPSGAFTATDTLPPTGVTFVSAVATVGTPTEAAGVVTWTIPAPGLAPGAIATLTVTVTVTAAPAAGTSDTLTNMFLVTPPPGSEPTEVENPCLAPNETQSCADTIVEGPVPSPQLTLSKTVDKTTAATGDTLTYTIEVLNSGNTTEPFTATDTLPTGVTFVSAVATVGMPPTEVAGVVTWTVPDPPGLAPGARATLTITVTVAAGAEATTQINEVSLPPTGVPVVVDPETECTPPVAATACAETVVPGVPRLTQSKTVDMTTAAAGDTLTYTMNVANTGTADATDVTAIDALPSGVTFVSATATPGTFDSTTGVWTIPSIAPGATATLTIVVTVNSDAEATTQTNRFQVLSPPGGEEITVDNACSDNPDQSCAETVIPGVPRLTQSKVVSAKTANVGDTLTYTMNVGNQAGTADATNVTATDTLPPGVTFVSATPSQGTFDSATGVWTIGTIAPGATATLTVVVTVNSGTVNTSLVNRFVVDPPNGPVVDPQNPCADQPGASCATTNIPGVPLLTQGKTVDKQTAAVGNTLTYTITITNHGTGDASPVTAQDFLPAGVSLVSVNTNGLGTFDEPSSTWTLPLLSVGTTATLTLAVTVQPSAVGQTLTNQLSVTPPPGSGPTTVNDPCANDATRSCASTIVPSSHLTLAVTGSSILLLDLIALGLVSAGVFLLVAARTGVRRRDRHAR